MKQYRVLRWWKVFFFLEEELQIVPSNPSEPETCFPLQVIPSVVMTDLQFNTKK